MRRTAITGLALSFTKLVAVAMLALVFGGDASAQADMIIGGRALGLPVFAGAPFDAAQFLFGNRPGVPGMLPPGDLQHTIFDEIVFRPTDVGRTFTITASSDPDFTALTAVLTNGVGDGVELSARADPRVPSSGGTGVIGFEAGIFNAPRPPGVDFSGFTITSISLRLDGLTINPTEQGRYAGTFDGLLAVNGVPNVVPEPAGWVSATTGALLGLGYARRHRSNARPGKRRPDA